MSDMSGVKERGGRERGREGYSSEISIQDVWHENDK